MFQGPEEAHWFWWKSARSEALSQRGYQIFKTSGPPTLLLPYTLTGPSVRDNWRQSPQGLCSFLLRSSVSTAWFHSPQFQSCLSLPSIANSAKLVLEVQRKESTIPYVKFTGVPPNSLHPSSHDTSELMGMETLSSIQKRPEVETDPGSTGGERAFHSELSWPGYKHIHWTGGWRTTHDPGSGAIQRKQGT